MEQHGYQEFTYTRRQFDLLKQCLDSNDSLHSGLYTFIHSGYGYGNDDVLFWLRFAEKIQKDPNFIESHFVDSEDKDLVEFHAYPVEPVEER